MLTGLSIKWTRFLVVQNVRLGIQVIRNQAKLSFIARAKLLIQCPLQNAIIGLAYPFRTRN